MLPLSTAVKISQGVPASHFAADGCLFPRRFRVRMSETSAYKDIFCDCGRCIRCNDNKRDQMATRMCLHALSYEYVYFVTLTYGSYNLVNFKSHPFLSDWLETFPILSNFNSFGKPRITPTLLIRSHLTKFLKRLRAILGFEISYCGCGEYGSTYCRPHFHLVIYSHQPILKQQVQDAWSVECQRTTDKYFIRPYRGLPDWWLRTLPEEKRSKVTKFDFPLYFKMRIGDVDFHDLVANGSLNFDGKHPGEVDRSAFEGHDSFTYVAKYLGKDFQYLYASFPHQLRDRVNYAYDALNGIWDVNDSFRATYYAKIQQESKKNTNKILFNGFNYEVTNFEFQKMVAPFFVSSRRPSIGKLYYLENRSRFASENYSLPKFMGKTLAFPNYFNRLISYDRYPIRLRKVVSSGISPTKDLLPRLEGYLSELREDSNYYFRVRGYLKNSSCGIQRDSRFDLRECYCIGSYKDEKTGDYGELNPFYGTLDQIDFYTVDDTIIHFNYNPFYEIFEGYVFDRSIRDYVFKEYIEKDDFCDMVIEFINTQYSLYDKKVSHMDSLFAAQEAINEDSESEKVREKYLDYRKELTKKHNLTTPKIF